MDSTIFSGVVFLTLPFPSPLRSSSVHCDEDDVKVGNQVTILPIKWRPGVDDLPNEHNHSSRWMERVISILSQTKRGLQKTTKRDFSYLLGSRPSIPVSNQQRVSTLTWGGGGGG